MFSHSSSEPPVFESPPPSPSPPPPPLPPPNAAEQSPQNPADEQPSCAVEVAVEVEAPVEDDGAKGEAHCQASVQVAAECTESEMNGDVSRPDDDALPPASNNAAPSPPQTSLNQPSSHHNLLAAPCQIFSPAEYLSSFNILRLSFHKFDSLHNLPPLVCRLILTQVRAVWR
jgi:hypothetical protein